MLESLGLDRDKIINTTANMLLEAGIVRHSEKELILSYLADRTPRDLLLCLLMAHDMREMTLSLGG